MKTNLATTSLLAIFVFAIMWSCVEDTSRTAIVPLSPAPLPRPSLPPDLSLPKPFLAKPPMLGPVEPNMVVLPPRIDEPEIRVRLTDEEDRPPVIPAGKYRGRVDVLRLVTGKYVAVNSLPLESYLQGVVAKELLPNWSPATFRAQAIAARTFALFEMSADGRLKPWDVSDDQSSQVYGGIAGENAAARAAVAETRGQVLTVTIAGRTGIFCSRYSACIGGASQDPADAWGDPSVPPLAAHVTGNVDENSARYNWDRDFVATRADVTRCVQNWGARNNFPYLQALGERRLHRHLQTQRRHPPPHRTPPHRQRRQNRPHPGRGIPPRPHERPRRQGPEALLQQLRHPRRRQHLHPVTTATASAMASACPSGGRKTSPPRAIPMCRSWRSSTRGRASVKCGESVTAL